jgi:hypothetical protein
MWKMKPIRTLALQKIPSRIQNTEEWIEVLRISTDLKIQELREMAIREIHPTLCEFGLIELGIKFGVGVWLKEGYTTFVTRTKSISVQDEERLGWDTTSKLFRVRHRHIEPPHVVSVAGDIQATFKREFRQVQKFNDSPISNLSTDLRTETDLDAMQHDKEYYFVDIIFLVSFFFFWLDLF